MKIQKLIWERLLTENIFPSSNGALILNYSGSNKWAFNVLIGSLVQYDANLAFDIYLIKTIDKIAKILPSLVQKYNKIFVGISLGTTQLKENLEAIRTLSSMKKLGQIVLICGGSHASGDPLGTLELGFDYVIAGDGEKAFPELIRCLSENIDPIRIKGLAYLENSKLKFNGFDRVNLDNFPPYCEELGLFNPIEITRGCPFGCKYCQVSYFLGFKPRHRSLDLVLEYTKRMLERGLVNTRYISPNILSYGSKTGQELNMEILEEFFSKTYELSVIKYHGNLYLTSFPSTVRPDFINEDTIKLISKYTTRKRISFGAQSGSDKILKKIGRQHTVDDVINAVKLSRKYGFIVDVDFIFGLPGEAREDVEATFNLIKKLVELGARIRAHVFLPLPGTPFSNAPIGKIDNKIMNYFAKLTSKGHGFGPWLEQIRMAKDIDELRRKGIIKPCIIIGNNYKYLKTSVAVVSSY